MLMYLIPLRATAGEINLIDGTNQLLNLSSTDLATFAMSRTNFFERYLIPKLRCVNAAWEASLNGLAVKIWLTDKDTYLNYEWYASILHRSVLSKFSS